MHGNSKPKKGDWIFIVSSRLIGQQKFEDSFGKRGIFGRIIEVNQFYSRTDGRKLPLEIMVRCYFRDGRSHIKTTVERIERYKPKI